MKFLEIFILIILYNQLDGTQCKQTSQNEPASQYTVWGDLGRSKVIVGSAKTKYGFPYVRRSVQFTYPDEFDPNDDLGIVRGIKHSNHLSDKDCQPEAQLIKGGINDKTAVIKITSERGCGIDSLVEFYIEHL